jgi:hypothetical protein
VRSAIVLVGGAIGDVGRTILSFFASLFGQ